MKPTNSNAKGATENPQCLSSATLEELGASPYVVSEFIREGSPATSREVAAFARALALQALCVKESAVEDALAVADQYNDKYDVWNRQGVDTAKRPDPRGWLARCPSMRDGFEQCLAMLPEAMTVGAQAEFRRFAMRTAMLQRGYSHAIATEGLPAAVTPMETISFPKRRPRDV